MATAPFCAYGIVKIILFATCNVSWLVIGILLWLGSTSQYGQVIEYETAEWDRGSVVDVTTSIDK